MEISVSFYHEFCDHQASEPVAVYIFVMLCERYIFLPLYKNIFYRKVSIKIVAKIQI